MAGPVRFAVGAQAVLPAGLGEGDHACARRHAAPSRGRSQTDRAGGSQPRRLLEGPWQSSSVSRREWPIERLGRVRSLDVLDAGKKTQFDQMMQMGTHAEQYLQLAGRDSGRLIG